MALISKLVSTIAEVEDLPEGTVGLIARHAREAGLLSQGARGRNAPHATVRDCANLLMAVNATNGRMSDVPSVITTFRDLPVCGDPIVGADPFSFLTGGTQTFGNALEGLLTGFADGSIPNLFEEKARPSVAADLGEQLDRAKSLDSQSMESFRKSAFESLFYSGPMTICVRFHRPRELASIEALFIDGGRENLFAIAAYADTINDDIRTGRVPVRKGDREDATTIFYRTLAAVAALLK